MPRRVRVDLNPAGAIGGRIGPRKPAQLTHRAFCLAGSDIVISTNLVENGQESGTGW